jgi:hypothetical protein
MRRDSDHFGDDSLSLVFVAQKLRHALRVEDLFTESGVDYLVESDEYTVGAIFRRVRVGAFFYVSQPNAEAARALLVAAGFRPTAE